MNKMLHLTISSSSSSITDINSLYPYVNKTCNYPIGHPKILIGSEIDVKQIRKYYGLIHCTVLPPSTLLHPVLPTRINKKLMFVLCRQCAVVGSAGPCNHTVEEKCLRGTFTSPELFTALDVGYKLLDVSEVWHFEETSNELFRGYINRFLSLKQESRGWPTEEISNDPVKQQQYIEEFYEAENVRLRPERIHKNPGLYQVAKICLNSFWG